MAHMSKESFENLRKFVNGEDQKEFGGQPTGKSEPDMTPLEEDLEQMFDKHKMPADVRDYVMAIIARYEARKIYASKKE